MDKLEHMFETQKEFEDHFFRKTFGVSLEEFMESDKNKLAWNKEFILCLMKESSELLDNLNWKHHTDLNVEQSKDNFIENSVDLMKYLFALLAINGVNANELFKKFVSKSVVVKAKFEQKLLLEQLKKDKDRKIAVVDIDGVLSDYPDSFLASTPYLQKFTNIQDAVCNDYPLYNVAKKHYRTSGVKASIEIREGAKELLDYLKDCGYFVILLTARPYDKVSRIYQDTLYWLDKNKLKYDAIIWEKEKAKYAIKHFKENNVVFCIDDEVKQVNKLSSEFKTYFVTNEKLYRSREQMLAMIGYSLINTNNIVLCDNMCDVLHEVKKGE